MADGAPISKKPRPKIAFTGEEFGFGYLATNQFVTNAARYERSGPGVADGGYAASKKTTNLKEYTIREEARHRYDFEDAARQPLRTKEQALMSLRAKTADFAVVPFYSPYTGYDFETLRAMANLITVLAVEQVEAIDQYCLAVYEPQVLDLVQSSHPGSALSQLLGRRSSYGDGDRVRAFTGADALPNAGGDFRASLQIDQAGQMLLRDRIDMVFCGPDAGRRCKSKLDGLRAAGVDVAETLLSVEPHREMARLARRTLRGDRQVNTSFDPTTGAVNYLSTMTSEPQQMGKLYGVVLPYQMAMMSADFTIIDHNLEDADPAKTRFFVVNRSSDETLFEDALRTTDAKTRYWMERLRDVNRVAHDRHADSGHEHGSGGPGVRVMMRFQRAGNAASIADLENYLRNHGVRHAVARMDEDSEKGAPAGMVLDIEFSCEDFRGDLAANPGEWLGKWFGAATITAVTAALAYFVAPTLQASLAPAQAALWLGAVVVGGLIFLLAWFSQYKRTLGSVANGAMKTAFKRWKNRGGSVLAAMPFDTPQLPDHSRRRWYSETPKSIFADAVETASIRLSRLAPWFAIAGISMIAGAIYLAWRAGYMILPF